LTSSGLLTLLDQLPGSDCLRAPRGRSFLRKGQFAMSKFLRRLFWDEDGPTAVEYAVMLALIIGVCVGAVTFLGTQTNAAFEDSQTKITSAMGS
jgi:pilus assembly protein Flp/PilA